MEEPPVPVVPAEPPVAAGGRGVSSVLLEQPNAPVRIKIAAKQ
jgi:hypothetical protein